MPDGWPSPVYIMIGPTGLIIDVYQNVQRAVMIHGDNWQHVPALSVWEGRGDYVGYRIEQWTIIQ